MRAVGDRDGCLLKLKDVHIIIRCGVAVSTNLDLDKLNLLMRPPRPRRISRS